MEQLMKILFTVLSISTIALMAIFSFAMLKLDEKNINFYEKLCRNRKVGIIIGFPLVCWCVPHAQVIVFGWAEAYLWYLAVVLAVLSYFYLDYLAARALAGLFIIGAYYFVHAAFEFSAVGAVPMTIIVWLWGIAGIIISAKPSLLRDYLRRCSRSDNWKLASHICFSLSALAIGIAGLGELFR